MTRRTHRCAALLVSVFPTLAAAGGIELRGTAQMGLIGGTDAAGTGNGIALLSELELRLRVSRTTDDGLTFGFEFDLDSDDPDPPGFGPLPLPPRTGQLTTP